MPHILIVDARFYEDLAEDLFDGATHALREAGATWDHISVPGALEIPVAIRMAQLGTKNYDGYVALGCVIRGETTHYDIVAGESSRAIMDLGIQHGLAIGNGIQTVENRAQAEARTSRAEKDKGGGAAKAALALIAARETLGAGQ
ncbi:MAG: 6,7-dimethyl-8-ribityllumazine synthase [Pseudomonadota bacterium]